MESRVHNRVRLGNLCLQAVSIGMVKAIMSMMDHMLMSTLIVNKPTITYSQLCTLLAKATFIISL